MGKYIQKLVKTEKEWQQLVELSKQHKVMSFDTENGGVDKLHAVNVKHCNPAGFSVSFDGITGFYVPINHTDIKTEFHKRFNELLETVIVLPMWNAPYDGGIVQYRYNVDIEDKYWWDCMVAQHLIDETDKKGLKYNSEKYFGYTQDHFDFGDCSKVSSEAIFKYACDDAIMTFKHYERLQPQLKKEGLSRLFREREIPLQPVLAHMKWHGVTFDTERSIEIEEKAKNRLDEIIPEICAVTPEIRMQKTLFGGPSIPITDVNKPNQLKKLLFDDLNLTITEKTETGLPKVDKRALKNIKDEHPIIPLLIENSVVKKIYSTYTYSLRTKVMKDNKIFMNLNDVGTKTGRFASNSPNLQNLPSNDDYPIRECFIAPKGYKMIAIDYSQQEYRFCGHLCDCKNFKELYKKGKDLHLTTANDCYNLGIPEEGLIKSSPKYKEYEEKFHKHRKLAKSINFGILYGMGAKSLGELLGVDESEGQRIIDAYSIANPEIITKMKHIHKLVDAQGFVRNYYGRKRRFTKRHGRFYSNGDKREAFNHQIQSSCADMLRGVFIEIYKYVKTTNDEVIINFTVHDELVFSVKDNERKNSHLKKLINIMETTEKFSIYMTADCGGFYNNYADAK